MQVGTAQSQSLIASVSVSTQIQATKINSKDGGSADAVLLNIGSQIDVSYSQKVLETELGQQLNSALQQAGVDTGMLQDGLSGALNMSPEATANRIVAFATSFFGAFQANNAEQGGPQQVDGFAELIRGAVEEGFTQARDILEGIGKISGNVSSDIDRTFGMVMQGIDDFADEQRTIVTGPPTVEDPSLETEQIEDLLAI